MACLLANAGFHVHGVDINAKHIKNIHNASVLKTEPDLASMYHQALADNCFTLSTDVVHSNIYLIAVPTPISNLQADLSYLQRAIEMITPHLDTESLVIIESTCPIGTTEKIAKQLDEQQIRPHLVYCPERMLPGNCLEELIYLPRVIGGINIASSERAISFYKTFVKAELLLTDSKTAEMIKLAENTFRDVNIAYANELSLIAHQKNINIDQVIAYANYHPRVNIHAHGIGVGGHCLAVDPYFLIETSPDHSQLIRTARRVNDFKSKWVAQEIKSVASNHQINSIACLGLTYKANVADVRNAPAQDIIEQLKQDFTVMIYDPYISESQTLEEINKHAEMVVVLVAHDQLCNISSQLSDNIIYLDMTGKCG